ncbi:hypothetical protein ACIPWL_30505 [Streptomyces sp. NPDC090023]|uniref:hypothetical protein n=1 Tax=unclassified Streptomyces TaxID=2593676 RepID=UPI00381AFCD7
MSTLELLVVLLLTLVSMLIVGTLGYAVHRRPSLTQPVAVALTGAAFLVAVVAAITSR